MIYFIRPEDKQLEEYIRTNFKWKAYFNPFKSAADPMKYAIEMDTQDIIVLKLKFPAVKIESML